MSAKITMVKNQEGKKDIVKEKGKSGYYIKLKSGKIIYGGTSVKDAKKRVQEIMYFKMHGK